LELILLEMLASVYVTSFRETIRSFSSSVIIKNRDIVRKVHSLYTYRELKVKHFAVVVVSFYPHKRYCRIIN